MLGWIQYTYIFLNSTEEVKVTTSGYAGGLCAGLFLGRWAALSPGSHFTWTRNSHINWTVFTHLTQEGVEGPPIWEMPLQTPYVNSNISCPGWMPPSHAGGGNGNNSSNSCGWQTVDVKVFSHWAVWIARSIYTNKVAMLLLAVTNINRPWGRGRGCQGASWLHFLGWDAAAVWEYNCSSSVEGCSQSWCYHHR